MSEIQATGYCAYCERQTMFVKPRINHLLHFLIGFPTVSIWWWTVWPIVGLVNGAKPMRCATCGMTGEQGRELSNAEALQVAQHAAPSWQPPKAGR